MPVVPIQVIAHSSASASAGVTGVSNTMNVLKPVLCVDKRCKIRSMYG